MTDPDGHCWPLCTVLAGAAIGAIIGGGANLISQQMSGHCCDWGQVGREAAVGAVSGAISGLAGPVGGPVATILVHAAVGAAAGGVGQVVSNAWNHKPLGDGVGMAMGVGALTGGLEGGVTAALAARAARGFSAVNRADARAFTITREGWTGYPTVGGVPRPTGPFRLLNRAENDAARRLSLNPIRQFRDRIHAPNTVDIHHIQPLEFGGQPANPRNFFPLRNWVSRNNQHALYTNWWNALQRDIEQSGGRTPRIRWLHSDWLLH
jgi:hypothetical protein